LIQLFKTKFVKENWSNNYCNRLSNLYSFFFSVRHIARYQNLAKTITDFIVHSDISRNR